MSIGRISTYGMQQITLKNASQLQANLADLQTQLSSGMKSQDFTGIASQTEQFLSLENRIARTKLHQDNNKLAESRLNSTSNALEQLITTGTDLKNLVLLRRNQAAASSLAFGQQLQNYYSTIATQLNTNAEGRYLFAGAKTDTQPVSVTELPSLNTDGTLDTTYYQGGTQNIVTRVDEAVDLTLNVRADAPAFQKLMEGIALAKRADIENNDADLARAYDLIDQAVRGVTDLQSSVNANKVALNQLEERQTTLTLYWTGLKEEIGNADLVAASTQVAINQGILQASFQAFARINSLKLSDFLR